MLLKDTMNDDFQKANPHIKIGEETVEEIPVKKVKFDPETGKTFSTYELEKVKTTYLDVPKEKFRCQDGDHIFKCVNGSKGIFSCENCPFYKKVHPTAFMFLNGRLISKQTNKVV